MPDNNTSSFTDTDPGTALVSAGTFEPVEMVAGDISKGLLLICDHARNDLPVEYGTLGLPRDQLERHIGYDIGAGAVTRALSGLLNVPAILSCFSRLLIDPNRGEDDPTLVMQWSDGVVIPGNVRVDAAEIKRRKTACYEPYHQAITSALDTAITEGVVPVILSIHSFTPSWRDVHRPWHTGVLWDKDDRLSAPLITVLEGEGDLVVGRNEPYTGALEGDTLNRHGTGRGIAHALLEIRQDLIADDTTVRAWAERLSRLMSTILAQNRLF